MMLLLGLPQKQIDRHIGYVELLLLISQLKCLVEHLCRLIYGLLMMAMIVGPLMCDKQQGTKPASAKMANCYYSYYYYFHKNVYSMTARS